MKKYGEINPFITPVQARYSKWLENKKMAFQVMEKALWETCGILLICDVELNTLNNGVHTFEWQKEGYL